MRQADIFLDSEGDNWLERNRDKLGERDPVSEAIERLGIKPQRVLEVGCSNGWRLASLRDKYGCEIYGVEPSRQACIEAAALRVPVVQSSAAVLCVPGEFDVVIYGFALYLCDPKDFLSIAREGDAVLADGGHLIIHDFAVPLHPFKRPYQHRDGIWSYHFDQPQLWLAHPAYSMVAGQMNASDGGAITVLRKNLQNAFAMAANWRFVPETPS